MSNMNEDKNTETKEKVMTKYDRKMQRRQEQKKKEQKEKMIMRIVGMVVLAALAVWIISMPVNAYIDTHAAYVTINGEGITKAEFDYNYHSAVSNYINQYGDYVGLFGLDVSQDFDSQMYTDELTWKDYFEEMAVDSLKNTKGLKAEADAAGYEYDTTKEVEEFKEKMSDAAKEAGVSTGKYLKQLYGNYATMGRVTSYVEETARVNAYYAEVSKGMKPSEEQILDYYNENSSNFDSVDYYIADFAAQITSEAPTDEEIEAAKRDAFLLANNAETNLADEGERMEGIKRSGVDVYDVAEWLFDEERREGDTAVIEDESESVYYAVQFINRYLEDVPTANVRVIMDTDIDGQAILDEWNAGTATEDSFAELWRKYSSDTTEGGLYENLAESSVSDELAEWIYDEGRTQGDTTFINTQSGYVYVLYYVGQGDAQWHAEISDTLLSEVQTEYLENIVENVTVEDNRGKLRYLKVQEEDEDVEDEEIEDIEDAEEAGTEEVEQ